MKRSIPFVLVLASSTTAWADARLQSAPDVQHVTGGQEVTECAWLDTVAVEAGGGLCSGTLVHPRVVVFAAHCGEGDKQIKFGESISGAGLAYTRQTEHCAINPEYLGVTDQAHDWAFCVLQEEITEIPFTPPLFGCELDMLQAGLEVAIVGFGDTVGTGGPGTKRWATTTVVSTFGNTINIGGDGISTCEGDSGGSAFVTMDDGSLRAISMVSTGTDCGNAGVHALMHPAIPWIESEAQIDITPCHDVDGTWNPTPMCDAFYAGGATGSGDWVDWCPGTPTSGPSTSCGPAFDAEDDTDPPMVALTNPSDGEEIDSGMDVEIAIDATDDGWGVKEVWIAIDGMEQDARDEYPPYGFPAVVFPDGVYRLQAFAVDWAGNVGMSSEIAIGVGMPAPMGDTGMVDTSGDGEGSSSGVASTSGSDDGGDDGSGGSSSVGLGEGGGGGGGGCGCTSSGHFGASWLVLVGCVARRRRARPI